MVKIKVKLRPSSIEGKAGSIYYYVSHNRKVRHIRTNIRIQPDKWDWKRQCIAPDGTNAARIQNRIDSDRAALRRIIQQLESARQDFTPNDIVALFRAPERQVGALAFLREQAEVLIRSNKYGTARNYLHSINMLSEFLDGHEIQFSEFTPQFVEQYSSYLLRRGIRRNSLSFYMRVLRAVYNKAMRRGYTEQTFPFRDVYTSVDHTRKRAVNEDLISRLIQLDLSHKAAFSYARDIFLFCLYTRGMAFIDMAYLQKADIQNGIIRYTRHKTGQQLIVRVEPCIQAIIDRYANAVPHSPYVFPVLRDEDSATSFQRYKNELRSYNYRLSRLSRMLGLDHNLSSYTSRHSWATMARNHNVPLSVISAGMGHSSERTTQIYLTSLENSLIDNANKGLLENFSQVNPR